MSHDIKTPLRPPYSLPRPHRPFASDAGRGYSHQGQDGRPCVVQATTRGERRQAVHYGEIPHDEG